ncbi:hypothetical protein CBR_g78854 [Chara braunii]|uniref:DDE Tnp4 domain-containing protein n=1 Tax=Chara braunii TaxID=69332 RepID=A0A388KAU8_CHABU|nr:hypothetical protein CBR_g78854 [Chara braunii]|eukprot:GBG67073.1 hypothetical protein CBR_g78854 [Chara braunii]
MALLLQHFMQMSFESDLLQLAVLDSSFMIMATAMAVMEGPSPPRWWVRPRADGAWHNMTRGDDAAEDYYFDNMRMREVVFRGLVANLEPYLQRQHTWYRAPTPPDKLAAYALYRWATGTSYDVRVLMNSSLRERAEDGSLFRADPLALPGGIETSGYLLGYGGYPSLPWLVVPFGGPQEDGSDTEVFDTAQKRCRGRVERAFGRLKGMWRMFLRTHKPHITSLSLQFRAVCVIHNLLIRCGVQMDPALAPRNVHRHPDDDNDDDIAPPPPPELTARQARDAGRRMHDALRTVVAHHVREQQNRQNRR